jgi:hypothetical protein
MPLSIFLRRSRDVMRAYPDWNLIMQQGTDVYFAYHALNGDPDYKRFWDRAVDNPDETVYKSQEQESHHFGIQFQLKINWNAY